MSRAHLASCSIRPPSRALDGSPDWISHKLARALCQPRLRLSRADCQPFITDAVRRINTLTQLSRADCQPILSYKKKTLLDLGWQSAFDLATSLAGKLHMDRCLRTVEDRLG